jgi:hypothetical protein
MTAFVRPDVSDENRGHEIAQLRNRTRIAVKTAKQTRSNDRRKAIKESQEAA